METNNRVIPQVRIVLGSRSDLPIVEESGMLAELTKAGVIWDLSIISAHRNPVDLQKFCQESAGTELFIAVAGMAAALPGAIAAYDPFVPVIGVPLISDNSFNGLDALLAMVRMPPGSPVLVPGIGQIGLKQAAIAACQILHLRTDVPNKPVEIGICASAINVSCSSSST